MTSTTTETRMPTTATDPATSNITTVAGSAPTTTAPEDTDVVLIGAIVGGVAGALLIVAGIVALVVVRERAKRRDGETATAMTAQPTSEYADVSAVRGGTQYGASALAALK